MLKLIEDQGCKYNDKKFGLFFRKLSFSWSKNGFLSFVIQDLLTSEDVVSNRSPPGPLINKFCLVRIGLSAFSGWQTSELPSLLYFQVHVKTDLNACIFS